MLWPKRWALRLPRREQGWCLELVADVHSTHLAPVERCSGDVSCLGLGGTLVPHIGGVYFLHASLQMFISVSWPQQLRYNSGIENIVQLFHYFLCCLDLCLPCTGCNESRALIAMTFLISISCVYQYSLICYLIFFSGLLFIRSPVTCLNRHSHGWMKDQKQWMQI